MPGYDRYEKMRREIAGSVKRGVVRPQWEEDGKFFTYSLDGKKYRYDIAARRATLIEGGADPEPKPKAQQRPARGRQYLSEDSPDGAWTASFRDRNVWLKPKDGGLEIQVTAEGNEKGRIKLGNASWVYGEELGVRNAMWWSPDSSMLGFYRFDESKVPDYYLATGVTKFQNALYTEPYVKAGMPNPDVTLLVYHLGSKKTVPIETKFGPDGKELGHYVYQVRWSPDGKELLFHRTNRKQKIMELCAADPATGKCRVIVREEWQPSWTENAPPIQYLEEQKGKPRRFLWISERTGFRNIWLGDLSGKPLAPVTRHAFEVVRILRVDEKSGLLWYLARDGDNPYRFQLHRIGLDGSGGVRLTDLKYHHTVDVSPDGKHFVDVIETTDSPPVSRLCDDKGKVLAILAESDLSRFEQLGLQKGELFRYKAADGVTEVYGTLHKPSNFDPSKKYPLLVGVYAGPESAGGGEDFETPQAITEFGFLFARFDGRGTNGRGKAFKDALYGKLGVVEIDDQAAGVKHLAQRPYVDGSRVGIYGTSYGGYSSTMAILRYPEVFHVAVASSSVTDWRHYDSIYTERYMGLPDEGENKKGYDEGSAITYASQLKGYLLLFYGTADDNVHPANSYMLAQALQRAGKSFDMMAGPDQGHAGVNQNRMWEYFIEHLILERGEQAMARLHREWRRRIAAK